MNDEINDMHDLFDESIGKSLRQLGFLFPRTAADFKRIESESKNSNVVQPARLKDPYSFLDKRNFKADFNSEHVQINYTQNFAQAAREGNAISEEMKKKMVEDKLQSNKKKNDK